MTDDNSLPTPDSVPSAGAATSDMPPAVAATTSTPPGSMPTAVATTVKDPNFVLGVVGFALSLIGILNIAGLIISVIAFRKSRRLGITNGFALAGIIVASIGLLFVVIVVLATVPALVDAAQTCARLGTGVHELNGATYTCTPTSFRVWHGM